MRGFLFAVIPVIGALLFIIVKPVDAVFNGYGSECGYNRSHNFFYGTRSPYDRLLYTNHTYRPSSFFGSHRIDVELPRVGEYPRGTITYMEIFDQFRDGRGGCAYIRRGGIGYNFVVIRLTSRWNSPIDFIINVFGR